MAKRKRLAPAQRPASESLNAQLETKANPLAAPGSLVPPIARVAGDASTQAALDEVTETLRRARAEGRMVLPLPLAQIDETYLERDRLAAAVSDEDMQALKTSIAARGQQTPIEVVELGPERYGLISGWRRLQALKALGQSDVKALVTAPRDASDAYVAMIEENEIRVGLSYFERARLVQRAVEAGVFDSHKTALQTLFASASRAKRSKIKSFISVVEALGQSLSFPAQLGERLGLEIAKALSAPGAAAHDLVSALTAAQPQTAEAEQEVLSHALAAGSQSRTRASESQAEKRQKIQVSEGLNVEMDLRNKAVTLKGALVDPSLLEDLVNWLKGRH